VVYVVGDWAFPRLVDTPRCADTSSMKGSARSSIWWLRGRRGHPQRQKPNQVVP